MDPQRPRKCQNEGQEDHGEVENTGGGPFGHSATPALSGFSGHPSNCPCRETYFVSERWTEMTIVFRFEAA